MASQSPQLAATTGAFMFYPMTMAPIGATSNGGMLGLGSLIIAACLSWWAFAFNTDSPLVRVLIQMPLTVFTTFMAIRDAYCQYVSGWWWGF